MTLLHTLARAVLPAVSLLYLVCAGYGVSYLRVRSERNNRVFVAAFLAVLGLVFVRYADTAVLEIVRAKPISFEVFADEFDEMESQARKIATWGQNVYVKIPVTNTRREPALNLKNIVTMSVGVATYRAHVNPSLPSAEHDLTDIFAIQSSIAVEIAGALAAIRFAASGRATGSTGGAALCACATPAASASTAASGMPRPLLAPAMSRASLTIAPVKPRSSRRRRRTGAESVAGSSGSIATASS